MYLCSAGYDTRKMTRERREWRRLATRGVLLFGRAFDPTDRMRVWGPHQTARQREMGRRLCADCTFAPPPAPSRPPRAARPEPPARRLLAGWEREVADWEQNQASRREQAQERLADERTRLRLEAVWARPASQRTRT